MRSALIVLCVCISLHVSQAAYSLSATFSGSSFFNNFNFWTSGDPTNGYVNYISEADARASGIISTGATVYIGSDHVNKSSGRGRSSIRLTSKTAYNTGLFIIDLNHMPEGCGTWPAWWLVGPNWPNGGEIDIIEGVNMQTAVLTSAHTKQGCTISGESRDLYSGNMETGNCWISAPGQGNNAGCGFSGAGNSYGSPFNNAGGGVYALEWTNNYVRSFYWNHGNTPGDVKSGDPNPSGWGKPYAHFALGSACPSSFFSNMNMVFDLTFCGDWAGNVFASQCPNKGSCQSYVQNNPADFKNAYWEVNYVKVFHE